MNRLVPPIGLAVILAAAGCDSGPASPVKLSRVRGTLLKADGKPAAGATVTLHPTTGTKLAATPFAVVGDDGTFAVTSYTAGDGAPPGTYAVTVVWRSVVPDGDDGPTDKLKGKFADPARPLATVTVGDGETTLEPLRLK